MFIELMVHWQLDKGGIYHYGNHEGSKCTQDEIKKECKRCSGVNNADTVINSRSTNVLTNTELTATGTCPSIHLELPFPHLGT